MAAEALTSTSEPTVMATEAWISTRVGERTNSNRPFMVKASPPLEPGLKTNSPPATRRKVWAGRTTSTTVRLWAPVEVSKVKVSMALELPAVLNSRMKSAVNSNPETMEVVLTARARSARP